MATSSSSVQQSIASTPATPSTQSVRARADPAWDYCIEMIDPKGRKFWKCMYCEKEFKGGGIHRIKQHLAGKKGDAVGCKKVPYDVRYKMQQNLKEIDEKKNKGQNDLTDKQVLEDNVASSEVQPPVQHITQSAAISSSQSGIKRKSTEDGSNFFAPRTTVGAQPSIRFSMAGKEAVRRVDLAIGRFLYDNCIPMNVANSVYYQEMIDAIASIGSGYKGPTYHALRTNVLLDMKREVTLLVDAIRGSWSETGCTIMADGWQDRNNRQLINFLVYCPRGIVFVKSVDASDVVKDAVTLCNLFVELVEFAGAGNVVHFVTDNAANYKAAGRLLNDKFPSIFWSPCAAHCLNLILGDIGKMGFVSSLATRASKITKFVYNHGYLLAWLRKRDGWKEIIRPGPTRFATTFIALKSIHEHKHDLQALVTSKTFTDSRYSRDPKGKDVIAIVLDNKFWNDCGIVVQIVAPLVRLLRIVDADNRPSLGYVYDGMYRARKTIKNVFRNKKSLYKPYTKIIKQRWDRQLRKDIHAASYLLNPVFYYDQEHFSKKPEVMHGFLGILNNIVPSGKTDFVNESMIYRDMKDVFKSDLAIEASTKMKPGNILYVLNILYVNMFSY